MPETKHRIGAPPLAVMTNRNAINCHIKRNADGETLDRAPTRDLSGIGLFLSNFFIDTDVKYVSQHHYCNRCTWDIHPESPSPGAALRGIARNAPRHKRHGRPR